MSYNQKYFVVLKGREKKANKQKTRTKEIGSQCKENGKINKQLYRLHFLHNFWIKNKPRYLSIRDWIHVAFTKAELNQMSNWQTGTCMEEYENSLKSLVFRKHRCTGLQLVIDEYLLFQQCSQNQSTAEFPNSCATSLTGIDVFRGESHETSNSLLTSRKSGKYLP